MKKQIIVLMICAFCIVGCSLGDSSEEKAAKEKEAVEAYASKKERGSEYYYGSLSAAEKRDYVTLYNGLNKQEKTIDFEEMTESKIEKIMAYVRGDHPEMFWIEPQYEYLQAEEGKSLRLTPKYSVKKKDVKKIRKLLEEERDKIIASISAQSEYDKVKAVYDYITQTFEYVEDSDDNQNIISALIHKKTVCAGYAKTAQYLLMGMGIETTLIEGFTVEEPNAEIGHAWNMVKIDNDYYYFDSTWGDVAEHLPHTCYNFFLMSDVDMRKTYIPTYECEVTKNPRMTWANQNSAYMNHWDTQVLTNLWVEATREGRNYIEVKCNPEAKDEIRKRLEESQDMYTITQNAGLDIQRYYFLEYPEMGAFDIYY